MAIAEGSFESFVPYEDEHSIFVGQNGSGKTVAQNFIRRWVRGDDDLLRPRRYGLVYDAKGMLNDPHAKFPWGGETATTLAKVHKLASDPQKHPWIIYAPVATELRDVDYQEAFFRLAYERRYNTVCVDETYAVCKWQIYPDSMFAILTRGREMLVPGMFSTQRPSKIPTEIMTECKVWFVFRLNRKSDRKTVADTIPVDEDALGELPAQHFYFYRDGDDAATGPWRLRVKPDKGYPSLRSEAA